MSKTKTLYLLVHIILAFLVCLCWGEVVFPKVWVPRPTVGLGGSTERHKAPFHISINVTFEGQTVNLHLERGKLPFHKGFFVRKNVAHDETYHPNRQNIERFLYKDSEGVSSVIVKPRGLEYEVCGLIKGRWNIWPSISRSSSRLRGLGSSRRIAHVMEEVKQFEVVDKYSRKVQKLRKVNADREIPESLHVETLIFMSHDYHSQFKNDDDLLRYLAAFFQYVNLKYHQLEKPRVHFSILGVVKDSDESLKKFIKGFGFEENKDYVNDELILGSLGLFFKEKGLEIEYDIGVILTEFDLGFFEQKELTNSSIGIADVSGACSFEGRFAIIEDFAGNFSGVYTTVHEFGHLLGSVHDSQGPNFPLSEDCAPDKFIMGFSLQDEIPEHSIFSECSVKQFQVYASSNLSLCLLVPGNRFAHPVTDEHPQAINDIIEEFPNSHPLDDYKSYGEFRQIPGDNYQMEHVLFSNPAPFQNTWYFPPIRDYRYSRRLMKYPSRFENYYG